MLRRYDGDEGADEREEDRSGDGHETFCGWCRRALGRVALGTLAFCSACGVAVGPAQAAVAGQPFPTATVMQAMSNREHSSLFGPSGTYMFGRLDFSSPDARESDWLSDRDQPELEITSYPGAYGIVGTISPDSLPEHLKYIRAPYSGGAIDPMTWSAPQTGMPYSGGAISPMMWPSPRPDLPPIAFGWESPGMAGTITT